MRRGHTCGIQRITADRPVKDKRSAAVLVDSVPGTHDAVAHLAGPSIILSG